MMNVFLEDIDKVVLLSPTPEWAAETAAWSSMKCSDHDTFCCRRLTTNGGIQIRQQCRICGHLLGGARKHEAGDEGLPLHDPEIGTQYNTRRELERLQIQKKHARLQYEKTNSWFRDYSNYLESDEWRAKRRLILKRSGGIVRAGRGNAGASPDLQTCQA